MNPSVKGPRSTTWIWIVVALVIVLSCCLFAIIGGLLFMNSRQISFSDLFSTAPETDSSNVPQTEYQLEGMTPTSELNQIPEPTIEFTQIPEQPVIAEENASLIDSENRLLVITTSGLWLANEATGEKYQLSYNPVDEPFDESLGLSPNKKYYAYFTGFGGASVIPILEIVDLNTQSIILQLGLNGPNSEIAPDASVGDPAFEAMQSLRYYDSLAWSPDSQKLAFLDAIEGDNSDIYLFDTVTQSITRITDETSNAASLHWSPDSRFIQYVTINSFGTGAGFSMDGVWVYDTVNSQAKLIENSSNSGEEFLAWEDNDSFLIYSRSMLCEGFNLRLVDANQLSQQVVANTCFTGIAYDPENEFGLFSITEFNQENCPCGEPTEWGIMAFGKNVGFMSDNIEINKFEQILAYGLEFIPAGHLFTVYGDNGLQNVYENKGYAVTILTEVSGLKPYPSSIESYWAWSSYYSGKPGLWVVKNNSVPVKLSDTFTGSPVWSSNGNKLYYYEAGQLIYAEGDLFTSYILAEFSGSEILAVVK